MRRLRHEECFDRWLEEKRYKFYNQTFASFRDRCDAGEVPGLGPLDWRRGDTVSDTVNGDAEVLPASEKRDETRSTEGNTNPGNADKRPGPSDPLLGQHEFTDELALGGRDRH